MQREFNFSGQGETASDGLNSWHQEREEQQHTLARKLGLPVGQQVEVWLKGEIRLRGRLCLHEETLILSTIDHTSKFMVDGTPFTLGEMESCLRQ